MGGLAGFNLSSCNAPFLDQALFPNSKGFIEGRTCAFLGNVTCCMPCPLTDWVYPDSFNTMGLGAQWIAVISAICCVFLLLSWAFLPVEKTSRHYLSICLCCAIMLMNLGFIVPLAAQPEECADAITPNGMKASSVCAASGALLILGGWSAVMWVFLRSLSLHLQICWQVVVGRTFMWVSQLTGWGIPLIAVTLALIFSGVSFRFGSTCHINHENSLADLWIPLLVFAGITILIQFSTFGYCIKVYLASLADNSASTEGSGLPSYSNSIRTMTPKQAYRRVRRVIQLQWRGIAIVMLIIADVIFFSVVFVFQDNTVQAIKEDPAIALDWLICTFTAGGDKMKCMKQAESIRVPQSTIGAVLVLLAMNGLWLVAFVGRWSMVTGWVDLARSSTGRNKAEFVSVDARLDDLKKDQRSYEMLSRDSGFPHGSDKTMDDIVTPSVVSPVSPVAAKSPMNPSGRRTPDYFGQTARYNAPDRSFSSPRPPQQPGWEPQQTYARPQPNMSSGFDDDDDDDDQHHQQQQQPQYYQRQHSRQQQRFPQDDPMNPLGMNRI